MNGEVDAATLMEPWVTLAHKNGCKEICSTFYQGTENAGQHLDPKVFEAAMRAVRKAVKLIAQDKKKYIHYMLDEIPEKYAKQLTLDDFYLPRLRYVDPQPYTKEEFERAYNWMVGWDLVGKDAKFEGIVCNRI
jgi:NitT/TauT family transport system substrate-binding protein